MILHIDWSGGYTHLPTCGKMTQNYAVYLCHQFSSFQSISCVRLHVTPCSTPGFSVHHQLLELAQTHVHQDSDAIQPSHHLSSPSSPPFNFSQHQVLFQWVSSLHQVAKVLEFQLQHQSFHWTPRTGLLWGRLVGSPCSLRDSQESSPTPQFREGDDLREWH